MDLIYPMRVMTIADPAASLTAKDLHMIAADQDNYGNTEMSDARYVHSSQQLTMTNLSI